MTDKNRQQPDKNTVTFLSQLYREPLAHFLLVAAGLFAAHRYVDSDDRQVVFIDASRQTQIIEAAQSRQLEPLTVLQRDAALASYIDEEILFQEAIKRGYVTNSKVRDLLLQNMRYFISGGVETPTEEELKQFFKRNPDLFANQATVDIDHIQFKEPDDVPTDLKTQLDAGLEHRNIGDFDSHNAPVMRYLDKSNLLNHFDAEMTKAILEADGTAWHGPILSSHGTTHFFRVTQKRPTSMPTYEQSKQWVETFWVNAQNQQLVQQELDEIKPDYRVELQPIKKKGETND
ncbi:peptidyl-prolyl cis-trans isomerase [Vibrio sp. 10N.261.51.F12]|uniref:peptidylprolyl isomerase n=1 Tax=Vibrio sp. 10N.261.51.F12 TaxID=3229679 RepID=UPI00354F435E